MTKHRQSEPGDYAVGYKRTPHETKFKQGNQAARKGGRPKGRKNTATVVKEIVNHKVEVSLPGGPRKKMTLWEASFWRVAIKSAQGDVKAWCELNRMAELYGIAVPMPAPIDDVTSEDEDQMVERHFRGWARLNPGRAAELLRELSPPISPSSAETANVTRIDGKPTVRRVFFGSTSASGEESLAHSNLKRGRGGTA